MLDQPLVTIVTPVYNQAALVRETLDSVLAQDYPRLEYIVLDDGSTDGTHEVLAPYRHRVRLEAHSNMGEARTVNKGLALARGDLVGVVSSDDPLLPSAVSRIVIALGQHPDAIVAYPDWKMIDGHGTTMRDVRTFDYRFADMVRWHHCVPGPGTLFRKSILETLGGRDSTFRYVADFDFWLRAGLLGPFIRVPEILATYRVHSNSASVSQRTSAMAAEHVRLMEKFFTNPLVPPDVRALRSEAVSSAHFIAGIVCGTRPSLEKVRYFAGALRHSPLKYAGEYRKRLVEMGYHLASFWNIWRT